MTIEELQAELDAMCAALSEKGHRNPISSIDLKSGSRVSGYVSADCGADHYHKFFHCDGADQAFAEMRAYVAEQKSAEVAAKELALGALGQAIDKLNNAGFDHDVVAPITEGFKAMTENLLTHQPGASS